MEDDGRRAKVEIKRPRDETTDLEDDDTSKEDTSGYEKTSEEDDNSDGEESSETTLHSRSTHWSGGASTDTSDYDYRPGRSSNEPATTTKGQGQEQEHDSIESREDHEHGN